MHMRQRPHFKSARKLPRGLRLAIIRSSWHPELVDSLENAAREVFEKAGLPRTAVRTVNVPGCFEIPLGCKHAIEVLKVNGVLALGVIIQGETHHAELIARACTQGLLHLQLEKGIPIIHGVIFAKDTEQAEARTRGKFARGKELAASLLAMAGLLRGDVIDFPSAGRVR